MKDLLRNIVFIAAALVSFHAVAENEPLPDDTLYFYTSWQQMLDLEPEVQMINPYFEAVTPYEVYFDTGYEVVDRQIDKKYLAFSLGDSIWMLNSRYLDDNFKGDTKNLSGYVPLFFNEKVAYVVGNGPLGVKDIIFGASHDSFSSGSHSFYYIDFVKRKVSRVTHSYLSELLEDYHDLQMRYEGMKDYKKQYVIEDYFYKYIDRATEDIMHPAIVDLTE